jgi:antitoxin PrlF
MSGSDKKKSEQAAQCCEVAAVVRVDERGQMVLPKDIRDRMGLTAGDKLALTAIGPGDTICCLVLVKAGALVDGVRLMIRAVTQEP